MPQARSLDALVDILREGGVIAYPTEAVWGLGCDPDDVPALQRLLDIKRRDPAKGVILVAADLEQCQPWLEGLAPDQRRRLVEPRAQPTTWLVPDNGRAHALVRGEHTRVALRISEHPEVQALCRAFGGPLVSTSANRAGEPSVMSLEALQQLFGNELDGILEGALGGHTRPSTIRDLATGDVLRA
ncbi:Sua5/YciO/YrdC/YwlC family protein [Halomonas sp. 18H]|uniref:L-threonylcarbamoyladenylate synthase n=1 Tax=Halomonas almeriensis TaxID=308163 RepID=UPI00222EA808|nr:MULTISPECIES: Sua5/YciO/YrdC/YwlC family protein [Halomonas]MCW4153519.1 Sua5/YciO/YrdC/YwlC family protein [Halomonas sp. 18H]MDN3551943.1 Sua5/YciO/YrdC/YwlC family protein [Halomonas almeriensis]